MDIARRKLMLVTVETIRVKKESIRKLSNFNFQWTKTLYQSNLNNIAFFFTFFKSYRYLTIIHRR